MPPSLHDLDAVSVRLSHGHRRAVDRQGRVRRTADLTVDCIERRTVKRADGEDQDEIWFKGHAAVFDVRTWIGGKRWGFWEEIAPGAFAECLARPDDVRFLVNHDPNRVLARNTSGTLTLAEDERGLAVEASIALTSHGRDQAILLERGDVTQMSFAFDMGDYEYTVDADEVSVYRHTRFEKLWDVASVTYPAYAEAEGGLRSLDRLMRDVADDELTAGLDDLELRIATAVRSELARAGVVPTAPQGDGGGASTDADRRQLRRRHLRTRTRAAALTTNPQQKG